jgi:protein involved in polysaccharide export with SLBB domain
LKFLKHHLFFLLFFTVIVSSQDFDKAYLDSLPPEVRDALAAQAKMKEELSNPVYNRQSTSIDKKKLSIRFGDNFFKSIQTTFMPINEPNMDASYVLDFGDAITLQLVGQQQSIDELQIQRDGSINLPNLGKVQLSGLSLEEASKLIKAKIESAYIGVDPFITLSNVRDIQILVTGNAEQPGVYTVNGNTSFLQAIAIAGGPSNFGSIREFVLKRNNETISKIDLYDVIIKGDISTNERLRSGDVIHISPLNKLVNITGAVKRPDNYELLKDETFDDLLFFANGIKNNIDSKNIQHISFKDGVALESPITLNQLSSIVPESGDSLYIGEYVYRTVTIEGAVVNPGSYKIEEGATLSSLIKRAGGYLESAFPGGGIYINQESKRIANLYKDKLIQDISKNIASKITSPSVAGNADQSILSIVTNEIKNQEVSGRVVVEFDLRKIALNKNLDTTLHDRDSIFIPRKTNNIHILGEVRNPTTISYVQNMTISDAIKSGGNYTEYADTKNIIIVDPDGSIKFVNNRWGMTSSNDLQTGSVIYIPREIGEIEGIDKWAIYTPIIGNVALSLASLASLNNNL